MSATQDPALANADHAAVLPLRLVPATRLPDWRQRFGALVTDRARKPFAWGRQDCAIFAADCAWAITGQDPAAEVRGAYSTAFGAARVLYSLGGGLQDMATAAFGPSVPPLMATVGDVVLVQTPDGPALTVCNGDHLLGPSSNGLAVMSLADGLQAWRVG